ncbi:hypothetical protein [Streptomyces sp. NPDC001507]|uniref:hypothetical protein n=1 Tax=Streptomyces sp. NPDC001507 TaxID=3364579 RepID=UPI0036B30DF9
MSQHQELIHGTLVVTQEIAYITPAQRREIGMTTRDVVENALYLIDPSRMVPPGCDIQGCTYRRPETADFDTPEWATHRVSKSRGLFRKRKAYFSCPEHLDTVKAALVFGHSGDPNP